MYLVIESLLIDHLTPSQCLCPKYKQHDDKIFLKNADFQPLIGTLGAMAPDMIYFSVFVKEDISLAKTA